MPNEIIDKTIGINAPVSLVWRYLTIPNLMQQWMLDTDMEFDIFTDWKVGNPFIIKGFLHQMAFENKGKVLKYEFEKELQYSHLSSFSQLPDNLENFCTIAFKLTPIENQTMLNLSISNFPTLSIFKHLELYWGSTIEIMKTLIEKKNENV